MDQNPKKNSNTSQPRIEIADVSRLRPDPDNANRHTQRGHRVVSGSISRNKFGRPGLATKGGKVIAGNLSVIEVAAGDLGAREVILVYSDGSRPIVHVREDLEDNDPTAVALAIEDNRASEVSLDWNPQIIEKIRNETPAPVEELWTEGELLNLRTTETELPIIDASVPSDEITADFGRLIPSMTGIVAGFGRFSALVESRLVDAVVKRIKEKYSDDPEKALKPFLIDLLVRYFGGEWPPPADNSDS